MITIKVENGTIINQEEVIRYLSSLNGNYLIKALWVNEDKTLVDYRNQYFAMVDQCANHLGSSRYSIHELFKAEKKIVTTTNFTIEDWIDFIEDFRWWSFNNIEMKF